MQITINVAASSPQSVEQAVAVVCSIMPNNDKQVMSTHELVPGAPVTLDVPPGQIVSIEPYVVGT